MSEEEDAGLRSVENNPALREKIRLRAKILRLSQQGWDAEEIAT